MRGKAASLIAVLWTLGWVAGAWAQEPLGSASPLPEPELLARSAILLEARSGEALFALNADQPSAPASMAKLMTLHLAWNKIAQGAMTPDELVSIGVDAWAVNFPPHSSLMFLEPGQRVTVRELMLGVAVSSGNDAAAALAVHVAGDLVEFVTMMNQEAAAMGYEATHYADPAGLSDSNLVTAREFADFCRRYVNAHPQALGQLHAVREFAYPQAWNLAPGSSQAPIVQLNRNGLLGEYEGVDGLKTGHIRSSGYNIALTAQRNGRRLVAVIMGAPGETPGQGGENLRHDGEQLLDYGFSRLETGASSREAWFPRPSTP